MSYSICRDAIRNWLPTSLWLFYGAPLIHSNHPWSSLPCNRSTWQEELNAIVTEDDGLTDAANFHVIVSSRIPKSLLVVACHQDQLHYGFPQIIQIGDKHHKRKAKWFPQQARKFWLLGLLKKSTKLPKLQGNPSQIPLSWKKCRIFYRHLTSPVMQSGNGMGYFKESGSSTTFTPCRVKTVRTKTCPVWFINMSKRKWKGARCTCWILLNVVATSI